MLGLNLIHVSKRGRIDPMNPRRTDTKHYPVIIYISLSHLPMNKMAAILADDTFKCIFLNENDGISIKISLKFVLGSPIDNKPALVQVMAWRRTGDEPLPELMLTLFTDAYMRQWGG